jgi:hypothetical protein
MRGRLRLPDTEYGERNTKRSSQRKESGIADGRRKLSRFGARARALLCSALAGRPPQFIAG